MKHLFTSLSVIVAFTLFGQKKPLTHDVYDGWKSIQKEMISDNGNWVMYSANPQVGDGAVHIRSSSGNITYTIPRAKDYRFHLTAVVAKVAPLYQHVRSLKLKKTKKSKMPKDSLYILTFSDGEIFREGDVKNYQVAKRAPWVAFQKEKPTGDTSKTKGTQLVLLHLERGVTKKFNRVEDYLLSSQGTLFFEQNGEDTSNPKGLYVFHPSTGNLQKIHEDFEDYSKLTVDTLGNQLAFLATENKKKDKKKRYELFYWSTDLSSAELIVNEQTPNMPQENQVSGNAELMFSYSGERLYFGTAPIPQESPYADDTTILDEERPGLDVWSWKDPYIQPVQKVRGEKEKKRFYQAVYHLSNKKMVQLASPETESVRINIKRDLEYLIGFNDKPYRVSTTWDLQIPRDIYKINLNTGVRTSILKGIKSLPVLSPEGEYLTYYNPQDSHWYLYIMSSGEMRNLTDQLEVSFSNELHDSPSLPGSYGGVVWSEKDVALYIHDRYDLWRFDPLGKIDPLNVTNGYGRDKKIIFRYIRLNPEKSVINEDESILFTAFHEWNKQSGYFTTNLAKVIKGGVKAPSKIIMADASFFGLKKARSNSRVILRKSTYDMFPEIWLAQSAQKLDEMSVLTNVGRQQEPYQWGTASLVSYNVLEDGEEMQGILYKPENFDPNKKYPMLVYFYERRSNGLHRYIEPAPIRSSFNIPLFVSNGYVVLVTDIKYQLGYPGQSAYNCVMPAVSKVIDMGFVDKNKIGLQGHSWGGYQVAYIVTRTNLFAAAESGAPVVNMTSAYGGIRWQTGYSRMFQYEKTQSRLGGTLWEVPNRYFENSPLFVADKIETPLLILHNDDDGAVPWYQGIEFYMALRRLSKPSWLLVYNGEPHGVVQRRNKKDFAIRMMQFFDHYLKEAPMPEWMSQGIPYTKKGKTLGYELDKTDR